MRPDDGWRGPDGQGEPRLVSDLALEDGGVKGIGLAGAVLVLDELGIGSFVDLRLTLAQDPGLSLPPERRDRMVVHSSDITAGSSSGSGGTTR